MTTDLVQDAPRVVALSSDGPGSDHELRASMLRSAVALIDRAQESDWRGVDLHDGLYWRWPRWIAGSPVARQVVAQVHVRAPVDIRVLRRGPRPRLAKTLALFTKAALLSGVALEAPHLMSAGRAAATELLEDRSAGPSAWGYPFPVQVRWSSYSANSPNIVVTSFAIDALLLAAQQLDGEAFRARARTAATWITERLLTRQGRFAYHEHSDVLIHNANLLGAAAVYRALGDAGPVRTALEHTLRAQRPDGSWPYGSGQNLEFVDSFHTAYVLSSLLVLREVDERVEAAIQRGAAYWTQHFFDDRGRARMWPDRRFPEDGHSAGSALSTLAALAVEDERYVPLLRRIAARALTAMIVRGHTVHRRHRWGRTHVRYLRWCDGHMAVGLAAAATRFAN